MADMKCQYHVALCLHLIKYNNLIMITNETQLLDLNEYLFDTNVVVCLRK